MQKDQWENFGLHLSIHFVNFAFIKNQTIKNKLTDL